MNVMLLLALFLVVFGTFGSAKKANSLKLTFGERSSRVERDLASFQDQINTVTSLGVDTCSSFSCGDSTDTSFCNGLCTGDLSLFQQAAKKFQDCLVQGVCGKTPLSNQLTNVNISIAPGSYPGSCYLTGQAITMALSSQSTTATQPFPVGRTVFYYVAETLVYTFTGLKLHCQPAAQGSCSSNVTTCNCPNSGQAVGFPCCGNDLLTSLVCLVQQIVGTLGTRLNLLACNCNCNGRKRDVESAIVSKRQMGSTIDSDITVTQTENFIIVTLFGADGASITTYFTNNTVNTQVSFTSALPSQYQADITAGIASVFDHYNTFYPIQHNFFDAMTTLFSYFLTTTCGTCGF